METEEYTGPNARISPVSDGTSEKSSDSKSIGKFEVGALIMIVVLCAIVVVGIIVNKYFGAKK